MHCLNTICRRAWVRITALGLWLLTSPAFLWAQGDIALRTDGPPEEKSYVNQYSLVILLVAIALFAVCRPSNRSAEIKAKT